MLDLSQKYCGHRFCTAGIHLHQAKDAGAQDLDDLKSLFSESEVVAVGETGLDFILTVTFLHDLFRVRLYGFPPSRE